jgi:hypothetical protein
MKLNSMGSLVGDLSDFGESCLYSGASTSMLRLSFRESSRYDSSAMYYMSSPLGCPRRLSLVGIKSYR